MATAPKSPGTTPAHGTIATLVRAPWTAAAWTDTAQIVVFFPIALVGWVVIVVLAAFAASLAVTAVLAIPFLAATFACSWAFASVHRARVVGFGGPPIALSRTDYGDASWLARLWAETRDGQTWRRLTYHLVSGPVSAIAFVAVVGFWTLGFFFGTVAAHGWFLPDQSPLAPLLDHPAGVGLLTVVGLVTLLAAPWVAHLAARLDTVLAVAQLTPSRSEELSRRVVALAESRDDVIDAADSERRRIERDLHDGTQQRLVSLAMNLGLTRTVLTDVPGSVRDSIEQAHEDAKLALSELRDVVRGMHPAVLDDLGLDAALSGIAARSPVPVRLLVELPRRLPSAVETVAYFVVSEALTNVAKHARATRVDIVVEQTTDDRLRIAVSDDGRGGAEPANGTGLRGLQQRIGSVDGTMTISSPTGGPTLIVVELPCA